MTWDPPSRRRRRHRGHGRTVPSPSHSFFSPTVQDRGKKSGKAIVMEIPLVSGRGVTILDWTLSGHIFQSANVIKVWKFCRFLYSANPIFCQSDIADYLQTSNHRPIEQYLPIG